MDPETAPLNDDVPTYQSNGIVATDLKTDGMTPIKHIFNKTIVRHYLVLIGSILIFLFGILEIIVGAIEPNKGNAIHPPFSPAIMSIVLGSFDCLFIFLTCWYYFFAKSHNGRAYDTDDCGITFLAIGNVIFLIVSFCFSWASYVGANKSGDAFTPILIWVEFTSLSDYDYSSLYRHSLWLLLDGLQVYQVVCRRHSASNFYSIKFGKI